MSARRNARESPAAERNVEAGPTGPSTGRWVRRGSTLSVLGIDRALPGLTPGGRLQGELEPASPGTAPRAEDEEVSTACLQRWRAEVKKLPPEVQSALEQTGTYGWQHPVAWAIKKGLRNARTLTRIAYFGSNGWVLGYCEPATPRAKQAWAATERAVKKFLAQPWPPVHLAGPAPCGKRQVVARPDAPGVDITGRYVTTRVQPAVWLINQAGHHIEGFASPARLRDTDHQWGGDHRPLTAFEGEIRGDRVYWFNRYRPDNYGQFRIVGGKPVLVAPGAGGKLLTEPMQLMEKRPTLYLSADLDKPFDVLMRQELTPLTPRQFELIRRIFDPKAMAALFDAYHNQGRRDALATFFRRVIHDEPCWDQRARARAAGVFPLPACEPKLEGFWDVDVPLVRAYAQLLLTAQRWTSARNTTMSHIQWLERMLAGLDPKSSHVRTARKYLGVKPRPPGPAGQYRYEFDITLSGASVLVAGYTGTVRVRSRTGPSLEAEYGIELVGGAVAATLFDVKLGDSFKGVGTSDTPWTKNDFYGSVRLAKAGASAGMNVASASVGFMHVFGNGSLPVMQVIIQDAGLGVPNYEKIVEDMAKGAPTKDPVTPGGLLKPEVSAMVVTGDITDGRGLLERYLRIKRGYDPVDISRTPSWDVSTTHNLHGEVHFCLDTDTPTKAARQALRILCARELAQLSSPASTLVIVGHADTLGDTEHNRKLSKRRAENTAKAIRDILGKAFKVARVIPLGLGETVAALASKGKTVAAPEHRRVQIFVNARLVLTLFGQEKR